MSEYGADDFTAELLSRRAPCRPLIIYFHHEYVDELDVFVVMVRIIRRDGTEVLGMCSLEEAKIATILHKQAVQWLTKLNRVALARHGISSPMPSFIHDLDRN